MSRAGGALPIDDVSGEALRSIEDRIWDREAYDVQMRQLLGIL